ncbi:MAG TPA: hypothetical protein PKG48_04125 [Bacteroidales bacterium]|nr:hypothetical protein [Bacteroidales bacterium]HPS63554.1 hypothetical protein [Bacteroidales bacterium]
MKTICYLLSFLILLAMAPVPLPAAVNAAPGCEMQNPKHPPLPKKPKKVKEPKEPKKPKPPKEHKKPKAPPKPPWVK